MRRTSPAECARGAEREALGPEVFRKDVSIQLSAVDRNVNRSVGGVKSERSSRDGANLRQPWGLEE